MRRIFVSNRLVFDIDKKGLGLCDSRLGNRSNLRFVLGTSRTAALALRSIRIRHCNLLCGLAVLLLGSALGEGLLRVLDLTRDSLVLIGRDAEEGVSSLDSPLERLGQHGGADKVHEGQASISLG